jgi:hypothetical protein
MTVVIRLLRTPLRRRAIDIQILSRRLLHFGELFLDPLDAPADFDSGSAAVVGA